MYNEMQTKLRRFLRNLDFQLEDAAFEKAGVILHLYFDTADIRDALLGLQAFYRPGLGWDVAKFYDKRTLVLSLAACGWLGKIRMLPPHQSELLHLLNIDLGVGIEPDPVGQARAFLRALNLIGKPESFIEAFDLYSSEDLLNYVRKQAASAIDFFKAIQCIRGNWHTKLLGWAQSGLLQLEAMQFDYRAIINSDEFHALKDAFDRKRPDRQMNNFADACVVALLISLVRQFNEGESQVLPRFLVPSPLFRDVVNAAGLADRLSYKGYGGDSSSILKDADYYVVKSIFSAQPASMSEADVRVSRWPAFIDLEHLRGQISDILEAQIPITDEAMDALHIGGKPLTAVIDELSNFSFFENVWLPLAAKEDLQIALAELEETKRQLQSEEFRDGVRSVLKATQEDLENNVRGYKRLAMLWSRLETTARILRQSLMTERRHPPDVFWDFGLLRFAYPTSTHAIIRSLFDSFLSNTEETEKNVYIFVSTTCLGASAGDAEQLERLCAATAILWVAGLDETIVDMLASAGDLPHFSLRAVYAAATFRSGKHIEQGMAALRLLESEYEQSETDGNRAHMDIALAYLCFHLWLSLGFSAGKRRRSSLKTRNDVEQESALIDKAINRAWSAYTLFGPEDARKKVYALNQCLYYMIEGGGDSLLEKMKDMALELVYYKLDSDLWQYKFDDTLAHYFHRLATLATTETEWRNLMEMAIEHAKSASSEADRDREVQSYKSLLIVETVRGFSPGKDH